MSEGVFTQVAFGRQTNVGTAVSATTLFPVDAGFLGFELDRATEVPDEDTGVSSRYYPGRGSHGVRWATASLPFVCRFEDFVHVLEMHVDAISGGTPTGTASPYTWTYTFDETGSLLSEAVKTYTVEYGVDGSTYDEWRALGCIADTLEIGFDALSAPGNSMWKGTLGLVALDREQTTIVGTCTAPTTLETMEGHYTTFQAGGTGTAFASLATLSGALKQFSISSTLGAVGRAYGGASDKATAIGRGSKPEITFEGLIAISSDTDPEFLDQFNVAGSLAQERRIRLTIDGTGVNSLVIDFRAMLSAVNLGEHENEHLYAISGFCVYDSTLGGRMQFTLTNAVATIP